MFYMHDIGWGWWLLMSIGMVAFWALIVYGVVALVRGDRTERTDQPPPGTPRDTLDRRLASGELSMEEYEELRAALEGKERVGAPS